MPKKFEKEITTKNYIIITLICLFTIGLTLYLCSCYKVYKESQKEIPVIRGTLSEITKEDLNHYVTENQSTVIYMCTASDDKCRSFEKDFKKLIDKKELQDSVVYLNLTNVDQEQFIKDFNNKYPYKVKLTTNYPAFVAFEDAKVVNVLQEKDKKLTISKTESFFELNQVGE